MVKDSCIKALILISFLTLPTFLLYWNKSLFLEGKSHFNVDDKISVPFAFLSTACNSFSISKTLVSRPVSSIGDGSPSGRPLVQIPVGPTLKVNI